MSGAAKNKVHVSDSVSKTGAPTDKRPALRDSVVLECVTAAVRALDVPMGHKLPDPGPAWGALRTAFHSSSDAARRALLLRLLVEERERIYADRGADL